MGFLHSICRNWCGLTCLHSSGSMEKSTDAPISVSVATFSLLCDILVVAWVDAILRLLLLSLELL